MFYVQEISTPKDTGKSAPKVTKLAVWAGVIHYVEIMFPPGPMGLLHVSISQGGHQLYPANEDQNFAADGETIRFNSHYKLHVGTNLLLIKTWNEDDVHAHGCKVRIGVLPEWVVTPYAQFKRIDASLRTLLRRIGAI